MKDRLEPLPSDVAAALGAERSRPGVDPATRERLRARVHASLLAGGGGTMHEEPEPPTQSTENGGAAVRASRNALGRLNPIVTGLVGLVIGVTTGIAVHAGLAGRDKAPQVPRLEGSSPPAPIESVSRASEMSSDQRGVLPETASAAPEPSSRHVEAPSEEPVPSASTLGAERALLDVAHSALGKGQAADALDALGRHARRFPHGVYREEREALTIESLRALGRQEEAERRAALFKGRYPKSLFLSIVEPPTGTIR